MLFFSIRSLCLSGCGIFVLHRRQVGELFEHSAEVCMALKTNLFRYSADGHSCGEEQLLGSLDSGVVQVFCQCQAGYLFEHPAEIIWADIEFVRDLGQGQLLLVVLSDVLDNPVDGMVGGVEIAEIMRRQVEIKLVGEKQEFGEEYLLVQVLVGMLLDKV